MSEDLLMLLEAQLEAAKHDMRRNLDRELFADMGPRPHVTVTYLTRWQRTVWRVRAYLTTLWRAVRGEDPYDTSEDY